MYYEFVIILSDVSIKDSRFAGASCLLLGSVSHILPTSLSLSSFFFDYLMSKNLLPRIKPRLTSLPRPTTSPSRLTRSLAISISQLLDSRHTNPHWQHSLSHLLSSHPHLPLPSLLASFPDAHSTISFFHWARTAPPHSAPILDSLAYSSLLLQLAKWRRLGEIGIVVATMREANMIPTRNALSVLLARFSDSGMANKAMEVYDLIRENYDALPHVVDCNSLHKLLVKRGSWDVASKVYDEMLKIEGGADNHSTCIMVNGFCIQGKMEDAKKLVEDRWGVGCIPNVVFYNVLIEGYFRHEKFQKGYDLFREMEKKGFLPSVVSYGILINGFCKKGDFDKVVKIFYEMKSKGVAPNVQVFNNIMDFLCKQRSVRCAKSVLKQMMENNCQPDLITFNTLISGFCRERMAKEAEMFLREAIRRGFSPNEKSYTPLIHGFSIVGEVVKATDFLAEMLERGTRPDLVTFGALIHSLVVVGKVKEALAVKEKMVVIGVALDCQIYNFLIGGLCKKGMLSSAKKLLGEMLSQNILPDEFVYTTLIDGFIRNDNFEEAKKVFQFMEEKGIRGGIVLHNAIIKGYCKNGLMKEAVACYNGLRNNGCHPDEVTFTTLISGFSKQGNLKGALCVLGHLIKGQCKPNVITCLVLMVMYCNRGDTEKTEFIYNYMKLSNLSPNVVTYTILVRCFFKTYNVIKAAEWFETMLSNKCAPNDATFHSLINGLLKCLPIENHAGIGILDLYMQMVADRWDHRAAVYNSIIFTLCRYNMLRKALEFKDHIAGKMFSADCVTSLSLLYGVCVEGRSKVWMDLIEPEVIKVETQIVCKYKMIFDRYICESVSSEVSSVLENLLEESMGSCKPIYQVGGL
ncbi:Pentatricopeptide repeat-containing protein [Rhynchospora pubera]|uniref:Pentatricopeptide repeat-containing protein n=1 Tax=Rhynchospora pubera TaxID=906938 RepID=A0AAV8GGT0_9POAL|nr:Pentatricopeptide repeat-containing protein [Rhynchospora pubera]